MKHTEESKMKNTKRVNEFWAAFAEEVEMNEKLAALESLKGRVEEELERAREELARASAFEEAVTAAAVGEVDSKQA